MSPTSFMSEHTAEYLLVSKLSRALSSSFGRVIPFFYWASREGCEMAKDCLSEGNVQLISVFARRPKIDVPNQKSIRIKINEVIFEVARSLEEVGVPVFAGIPQISSFISYTLDAPCLWFSISNGAAIRDVEFNLLLSDGTHSPIDDHQVVGPLSNDEIIDHIHKYSRIRPASTIIDCCKIVRQSLIHRIGWSHFSSFMGGYKPVYFVLTDCNSTADR